MAINATNSGTSREPIPAGNYIARCYQMIQIGTVEEDVMGVKKKLHKVRIGWELPLELRVFDEKKGEQPLVISNEYTLSMNEKATLRKTLASWRGKDFTEDEAKCFDITKLIGAPCMLNIIHKTSKTGNTYDTIGSISPLPKGINCPEQINKTFILQFDDWHEANFESLPDFIKDKIKSSEEFKKLKHPAEQDLSSSSQEEVDDLPF